MPYLVKLAMEDAVLCGRAGFCAPATWWDWFGGEENNRE